MNTTEKHIITEIIKIKLLQKFLNDPKRLGMTTKEQHDKLDAIEGIGA